MCYLIFFITVLCDLFQAVIVVKEADLDIKEEQHFAESANNLQ